MRCRFYLVCFFVLIFLGLPVSFAIGLSSIATLVFAADIPLTSSLMTMAQKMASGLDSFGLLAIPFFYSGRQYYESWWFGDSLD
ncbi:TRAP transporter large permease subunit [Deefgea sp. CFH1-16]|uniref:TRAP transporter large permease subunit n=1 Tax=Deefgea sp. CFH1-16 TaxID=2675457 RepID=UPI0019402E6E|nr:TRAP transporter large permease subunit [Deefgea sp. CFH1-16]